jgi:tetratricopeptide (TPR) repeat protein
MLDWSLFADHAGGHHLISLLLHIGSVLFLFFFLSRTTNNLWSSAFAAALFALHPLRVESLAWAAERKDVLSMFFGLASLYVYSLYTEKYQSSKYFLCLSLFALSLMTKPMLVTLPFVLLLLDYWPLGRWPKALKPVNMQTINALPLKNGGKRCEVASFIEKEIPVPVKSRGHLIGRLLWEKTPFIFLTIVSSIVTLWAQNKSGAFDAIGNLSFLKRIVNAIISYVYYLEKTFSPVDLAVFYPYEYSFPLWQVLVSGFILIGITIIVIYALKKMPFLFVGWFWYLGTLIPVIGLVQVGRQAMADRYTYLSSIGIAIMLAWGIPLLFPREDMRKKILFPAGIAYLAILSVLIWQQCGYWKNSATLFSHALQVTKNNYLAHNARGITYGERGQYQLAIEDFSKAIGMKQDYADAYSNRGFAYYNLGQYQLAIEDFTKAISMKQDYIDAYNNRGNTYFNQGNNKLGCIDARKACELGNCKTLEKAKGKGYCR